MKLLGCFGPDMMTTILEVKRLTFVIGPESFNDVADASFCVIHPNLACVIHRSCRTRGDCYRA